MTFGATAVVAMNRFASCLHLCSYMAIANVH